MQGSKPSGRSLIPTPQSSSVAAGARNPLGSVTKNNSRSGPAKKNTGPGKSTTRAGTMCRAYSQVNLNNG